MVIYNLCINIYILRKIKLYCNVVFTNVEESILFAMTHKGNSAKLCVLVFIDEYINKF